MPHSCEVRWRATALHCVNSKWEKQTGLRGPADSQLRLITYYAFHQDGDWLRRLKSSLVPGKGELDRAIVGAHRVAGRWASKDGLEFKRPGDRVRVQIQGEFTSLAFSCGQ